MSGYLEALDRVRGIETQIHSAVSAVGGGRFAAALQKAVDAAATTRPADGRISSAFGMRADPISGASRHHTGTDIAAPAGSPVRAAAAGTVSFAGPMGAYGNVIVIDHGDGLQTMYAHQSRLLARPGDVVAAGAIIGAVGSTGRSTGPHLHFEVRRNGEPVDPAPYLGTA